MSTIQDSVRDSIQKTLRSLGVTPNYQGYYQITDAIELAVEDENRLLEATQKIYQHIADRDGYKWSAVERNIRTVVQRTWKINPELLAKIAGYALTEVPTATAFIEIIAAYLLRHPVEKL